jgi:hypothetical protein
MRAKIRRLEEDNVRKRKEIDNIYDTNKVLFISISHKRKGLIF